MPAQRLHIREAEYFPSFCKDYRIEMSFNEVTRTLLPLSILETTLFYNEPTQSKVSDTIRFIVNQNNNLAPVTPTILAHGVGLHKDAFGDFVRLFSPLLYPTASFLLSVGVIPTNIRESVLIIVMSGVTFNDLANHNNLQIYNDKIGPFVKSVLTTPTHPLYYEKYYVPRVVPALNIIRRLLPSTIPVSPNSEVSVICDDVDFTRAELPSLLTNVDVAGTLKDGHLNSLKYISTLKLTIQDLNISSLNVFLQSVIPDTNRIWGDLIEQRRDLGLTVSESSALYVSMAWRDEHFPQYYIHFAVSEALFAENTRDIDSLNQFCHGAQHSNSDHCPVHPDRDFMFNYGAVFVFGSSMDFPYCQTCAYLARWRIRKYSCMDDSTIVLDPSFFAGDFSLDIVNDVITAFQNIRPFINDIRPGLPAFVKLMAAWQTFANAYAVEESDVEIDVTYWRPSYPPPRPVEDSYDAYELSKLCKIHPELAEYHAIFNPEYPD